MRTSVWVSDENHDMEDLPKHTSSSHISSFPTTPAQDPDFEFEFGCFPPDFESPADHLFFNGRLLPHSFPAVLQHRPASIPSRSSSVSSKDSIISSRSNSTNSRSSFSSPRTSWSDQSSEGRSDLIGQKRSSSPPMGHIYGSSQRWLHIMPIPAAALSRENCRRKNGRVRVRKGSKTRKKKGRLVGFVRRLVRSVLVACRECHDM